MSDAQTTPSLEVLNPDAQRGRIRFALFDFDGTLSLVREGWQGVMVPYFVEELLKAPGAEAPAETEAAVRDFVDRLTGKQTIFQCIALADAIAERGGSPIEPLAYKQEYLRRLWVRIEHRVAGLKAGAIEPDTMLLRGSRPFLDALQERGISLLVASGTDLPNVLEEAGAVRLDHYFAPHIYGAVDADVNCSKAAIIDRLLSENGLQGPELVAFGDGFVEIEESKRVGGLAVGVASDEKNPGARDEWKRDRLAGAGADAIIPDFGDLDTLMGWLFP
ncbi:MAG: haloacid dehalogenase-like hydrolase [Armatimonadetes bacterium]|nr:haloacid dehalogenase-like hydrolase [Armatimonadota bacterium]